MIPPTQTFAVAFLGGFLCLMIGFGAGIWFGGPAAYKTSPLCLPHMMKGTNP